MNNKLVDELNDNAVVLCNTDTVNGIIALPNHNNMVKINSIKKRNSEQPLQLIFASLSQLEKYVDLNKFEKDYIETNYSDHRSFIIKKRNNNFNDILNYSILFRIHSGGELNNVIEEIGPLIATSANLTNEEPYSNLKSASKILKLNYYEFSDIKQSNKSSNIFEIKNNIIKKIR